MPSEPSRRRPLLLMVNPESGGKLGSGPSLTDDAERLEPEALGAALRDRGLDVHLHPLTESDDVAKLAIDAANAGHDVVVGGGDGTVGRVAAALVGSEATLGILAMGSFNNVAHGIGVPLRLEPALDAISAGRIARVDAGVARPDGHGERQLFFEAGGVGLDAIGFMAVEIMERHGLRGWWRAAKAVWRGLRRRNTAMRLTIDGRTYQVRSPSAIVCNAPYHGIGFAVSPDADPSDGELDIAVFLRMTQFEILGHFLAVVRGRREREPRLHRKRARQVRVEAMHGTLPAHADGRSVGTTPITFSIKPQALRVFR